MASNSDPTKNSRFILLASVCLVVASLYFAREVLIPIALGILLTFLLTPPVTWLERIRLPRSAAAVIAVISAMGVVGGLGYIVGHQTASIVDSLPQYQGEVRTKIQSIGQHWGVIRKAEKEAEGLAGNSNAPHPDGQSADSKAPEKAQNPSTPPAPTPDNPWPVRVFPAPTAAWQTVRDWAGNILNPLATMALVLVLVIFMLISREDLRDRLIRLLGSNQLNLTTQALDEASTRISKYLGSLAIVNFCYGLLTVVGLWLIGRTLGGGQSFPNVLVWGILIGVLRFVPYIGIFIGAGFPLLLAFAIFPGNSVFFATLIMFAAMEIVVSQFIEPSWYGATTGMSPLAVLMSAVFWTWLWGPIGLLLSTPLTVVLVVVGKYVPQLKFIDILLREESVLSPQVRMYQRLVAMDQEDAADLARDYLKEHNSLEATYDELLIPALVMAERDSHHERVGAEQLNFVRQSVRELVDELADDYRNTSIGGGVTKGDDAKESSMLETAASTMAAAASTVASVASTVAAAVTGSQRGEDHEAADDQPVHRLPKGCRVNVLCLPARDEADEIVALMLSKLLEIGGYCALSPSAAMLASEMVELVGSKGIDLVCVSALPPAAVTHARYLCKRLHARFEQIGLVVGLWTLESDLARARDRISCSSDVRLVTKLHDAYEQIGQLSQSIIIHATSQTRGIANAGADDSSGRGGDVNTPIPSAEAGSYR